MADEPKPIPAEFAGWKAVPGGVLAGFQTPSGELLFSLLFSMEEAEGTLPAFVASISQAKAMAGEVPQQGMTYEFSMTVDQATFGYTPGADDVWLRVRLASGGTLGFSMPKDLARGLGQGLNATADQPRVPPKSILN